MKKTVSISLNGISFNVEEDAYLLLKNYLEDISSRLESSEGGGEILTDIESRISEILSANIGNVISVINTSMVSNVIDRIGAPHYFGEKDNSKKRYDTPPPHYNAPNIHKLMRDPNNRVLGGVCAGLAAYLHSDITLIRVVGLILFFFFGFGLIPYLILWIIIPKAKTEEELDMLKRDLNK